MLRGFRVRSDSRFRSCRLSRPCVHYTNTGRKVKHILKENPHRFGWGLRSEDFDLRFGWTSVRVDQIEYPAASHFVAFESMQAQN
jgi:hypothetical protein